MLESHGFMEEWNTEYNKLKDCYHAKCMMYRLFSALKNKKDVIIELGMCFQ